MANVIDYLVVAAGVVLSARLYFSGLSRRYQAFFFFLIFFTLQTSVLALLPRAGQGYLAVWLIGEPIEWFLYAWVVLELYSLVLKDYQGLYTVGRWSLIAAVSVALLASAAGVLSPSLKSGQGELMRLYYVAERSVYFSLVVFLLTILTLLARYPITLNRNTITYSLVFSIYFLCNAAIFVLISTRGFYMVRISAYLIQAINLGALATWLLMLNTAGEEHQRRLRPAWMPGREDQLVNQLNSLNAALMRATWD